MEISFNQIISKWDVSSVSDMSSMFNGASSFNGNIGDWDVSSVSDKIVNVQWTSSFNGDIGDWDVSSVSDMSSMFYVAERFNQDIGDWVVSSVANMTSIFNGASSFNQDISNWNVILINDEPTNFSLNSKLESENKPNWGLELKLNYKSELIKALDNMKNGFYKGVYINEWDVSSVTDMSKLFKNRTEFNEDISKWDVSSVSDMYEMFYYAKKFDQNLSKWDVSNVNDMSSMFESAYLFNSDISLWNVSKVTRMDSMFKESYKFNQDISTKIVSDDNNHYIAWDVSNVTWMYAIFGFYSNFEYDLSNWCVFKHRKDIYYGYGIKEYLNYHPKFGESCFKPKDKKKLLNAIDEYLKPEFNADEYKRIKNIIDTNESLIKRYLENNELTKIINLETSNDNLRK